MTIKFITIGVYGFTDERFFNALETANVDTFCDLRDRRGVRGSTYVFANSKRLQKRLDEMGIQYLHFKDLAPSKEIRKLQYAEDEKKKVAKRQRSELGQDFKSAYQETILDQFDAQNFIQQLPDDAQIVALFCVEKEPSACHRSLVAQKLKENLGCEVRHILP